MIRDEVQPSTNEIEEQITNVDDAGPKEMMADTCTSNFY